MKEGQTTGWEATEADEPDRKRGDEYRSVMNQMHRGKFVVTDDPVENWDKRAEKIPAALKRAALDKAGKSYPAGTHLVIYLNITDYKDRSGLFRGCVHEKTAAAAATFVRVWVLWRNTLYLVWDNGIRVFQEFNSPRKNALNSY